MWAEERLEEVKDLDHRQKRGYLLHRIDPLRTGGGW
jgi:hypothetical protein